MRRLFTHRIRRCTSSANDKQLCESIHNILGFYPRNIALYKLALRHKSASVHKKAAGLRLNNERLEYLGDAILGATVADFLFKTYPTKGEGFLTEMRSKMVSRERLNALAKKMGLTQLLTYEGDNPHQYKSINGDAFEALIGAVYLDIGYKRTYKLMVQHIIPLYYDLEALEEYKMNYKSTLLEYCQKHKLNLNYQVIEESGNGHQKQFKVEVRIDKKPKATAISTSIKGAEKLAAEKAFLLLDVHDKEE